MRAVAAVLSRGPPRPSATTTDPVAVARTHACSARSVGRAARLSACMPRRQQKLVARRGPIKGTTRARVRPRAPTRRGVWPGRASQPLAHCARACMHHHIIHLTGEISGCRGRHTARSFLHRLLSSYISLSRIVLRVQYRYTNTSPPFVKACWPEHAHYLVAAGSLAYSL